MMESLSKKVMLTLNSHRSPLGILGDITFVASTCLAYFLWEDLEVPPPAKPPTMVFVSERRVLTHIFVKKMEGMKKKKVWPILVFQSLTVGVVVLVKKYRCAWYSYKGMRYS